MKVHPDAQKFIFFHELDHIRLEHHGAYIYDKKRCRKMRTAIPARCSGMFIIILPRQFKNIYEHIEVDFRDSDRAEAMKRCVIGQTSSFPDFVSKPL